MRLYENTLGAIKEQVDGVVLSAGGSDVFDDSSANLGATTQQGAIEVLDSQMDDLRLRDFVTDFQTGLL